MGRVFRARHLASGQVRAIKVLESNADPELVVRFRREADALARLDAGDVVPVHESGVAGGRLYFAMDLMPGGSLEARIKERGRLPWAEAAELVAELARMLGRCHDRGFVHRDVKPANILFDAEDRPRFVDFGLSLSVDSKSLTETGTAIGSPGYMSPESFRGFGATAAADVFSLGVVLYELVTGVRPYDGNTSLVIAKDMLAEKRRPPSELAKCPDALEAVIARALAPKAEDRFASAHELAAALDEVDEGAAGGNTVLAVSLGVGLAVLILGGAAFLIHRARGSGTDATAPVVSTVPLAPPPPVTKVVRSRGASASEIRDALGRGEVAKAMRLIDASELSDGDAAAIVSAALAKSAEKIKRGGDPGLAISYYDAARALRPGTKAPPEVAADLLGRYEKSWAVNGGELSKMRLEVRLQLMRWLEVILNNDAERGENYRDNARTLAHSAVGLHREQSIGADEALRWVETALSAVPESSSVRHSRCLLLKTLGRLDRAMHEAEYELAWRDPAPEGEDLHWMTIQVVSQALASGDAATATRLAERAGASSLFAVGADQRPREMHVRFVAYRALAALRAGDRPKARALIGEAARRVDMGLESIANAPDGELDATLFARATSDAPPVPKARGR